MILGALGLLVLGLLFGSFVNALVYRLHAREELLAKKHKPSQKQLDALSMTKGRSMCPHCQHELAPKDLVPVFSWLYLRGKCRYCGAKIPDSPLVELGLGLSFVLSYIWWPLSFQGADLVQFIFWLFFLVAFMALTIYDLRWYILPDKIVYPVAAVALVQVVLLAVLRHAFGSLWEPLTGTLLMSGLFYLLFQLSDGKWIGGGDVKLALALGLLAGTPLKAVLIIFFASIIGTVCSIPILVQGKQGLQAKVPFGPFLLAATVVVVLFGTTIINWYTRSFLGGL